MLRAEKEPTDLCRQKGFPTHLAVVSSKSSDELVCIYLEVFPDFRAHKWSLDHPPLLPAEELATFKPTQLWISQKEEPPLPG